MKLTEHQDRYDKCVEKRLIKEYDWFLQKLKAHRLLPNRDLDPRRPEGAGFRCFRRRAVECNYILGMKPVVIGEGVLVSASELGFETPLENNIPFGSNPQKPKYLGRNPPRRIPNTPEIKGFGVVMSLAGWKIFLDITYDKLLAMLNSGATIEEIYNQCCTPITASVLCNGEYMPIPLACKTKGIYITNFYKKAKGLSNDERQKLFDEMAKISTPRIAISEQDLSVLSALGQLKNMTVEAVLHELICKAKTQEKIK